MAYILYKFSINFMFSSSYVILIVVIDILVHTLLCSTVLYCMYSRGVMFMASENMSTLNPTEF